MNDNINKNSLNEFRNLLYRIQNEEESDETTREEIQKNIVFNKLINMITQIVSDEDNKITEEDAFNMIINEYYKLISLIGINEIQIFNFKEYNNSHSVIVNNIAYNFDDFICNENVSEALSLIDSIIGALNFDNSETTLELILNRIEELIANR